LVKCFIPVVQAVASDCANIRGEWSFFCSTGVWTWGLHLEPLHQPFFMMGFFEIESWFQATILLMSASWVARIIGISHRHLSREWVLKKYIGWLGTLKISVHSCFLNCQRKYIWMCYLVSFVLERLYLYIYHIFIRKVFKTTNLTHKIGWQY
jgi:hypothetical protein